MVTGRRQILLADDSVAIQKVVQLTFADENIAVTIASDGVEALRRLAEDEFDAVLADVSMPALNGYELCKRIKRDENSKHIPVILLVGIFEPFDAKEARDAGADDVLTKPFQSIREMVKKVGGYLTGRPYMEEQAYEEQEARPLEILAPASSPTPSFEPPVSPQPTTEDETRTRRSSGDETTFAATTTTTPHENTVAEMSPPPAAELATEMPDDDMIEVKPGANLTDNKMDSAAMSTAEDDDAAIITNNDAAADAPAPSIAGEETKTTNTEPLMSFASEERPLPSAAADIHAVAGSDDSLLDLGETAGSSATRRSAGVVATKTAPKISDDDDLILDLGDEPSYAAAAATRGDQSTTAAAPSANLEMGAEAVNKLPPEVIEAIARRVVEQLSTTKVEEVVWEVVPQLAELLIKQQLDNSKSRKP